MTAPTPTPDSAEMSRGAWVHRDGKRCPNRDDTHMCVEHGEWCRWGFDEPDHRAELREVVEGSLWRRKPPGREVVEVQRVWDYSALGAPAVPTVRAHPTHGGKFLVAPVDWFIEHYTQEASA